MYVDDEMTELYRKVSSEGISIGVDTTGYVCWDSIKAILPYTSFFLWDLKVMDPVKHQKYTGVDNRKILENLQCVEKNYDQYHTDVYIRCVQIPGMTDDSENLRATCEFLTGFRCVKEIDLLNYHTLGKKRYEAIQRPYLMGDALPLPRAALEGKKSVVESYGFKCVIS